MKTTFLTIASFVLFVFVCDAQKSKTTSKKTNPAPQLIKLKPLSELTTGAQTWQSIFTRTYVAKNKVEILPRQPHRADSALYLSQLQESDPIGAVIYNCGGILINDGWVRILGSGCSRLDRSVPQWNKGKTFSAFGDKASYILVADDVLGGLFAVNKGGIDPENLDMVYYFGANSLMWVPLGIDYTQFLTFCFRGDLKNFYEEFHWSGCEADVLALNGNEVISCFPLLWTKKGNELMHCNRKIVTIQKQWSMYQGANKVEASNPQKKNSIAMENVK